MSVKPGVESGLLAPEVPLLLLEGLEEVSNELAEDVVRKRELEVVRVRVDVAMEAFLELALPPVGVLGGIPPDEDLDLLDDDVIQVGQLFRQQQMPDRAHRQLVEHCVPDWPA